jgi:hypothetical protein
MMPAERGAVQPVDLEALRSTTPRGKTFFEDGRRDAWRIFWHDPATMVFRQQIGRARGPDIVPEGTTESGSLSRWSFTKITPRSFHWLGEESPDGGASWRLLVEVLARRS